VKAVCLALQQAERYGTSLGTTMRVLAQENRDMRMSEAEKKAAALPPKLTVPMILFYLPVLFIVILGPAAIKGDGDPIAGGNGQDSRSISDFAHLCFPTTWPGKRAGS
jgi:tight adherence protein C